MQKQDDLKSSAKSKKAAHSLEKEDVGELVEGPPPVNETVEGQRDQRSSDIERVERKTINDKIEN